MDNNWEERFYKEECAREKARIAIKDEVERSNPKAKKALASYVSYIAIGVVGIAFMYYFGDVFGISIYSIFDTNFLLPIIIILGLFIAAIKNWI